MRPPIEYIRSEEVKLERLSRGLVQATINTHDATLIYTVPEDYLSDHFGALLQSLAERLRETLGAQGLSVANVPETFKDGHILRVVLTDQALLNYNELQRFSMQHDKTSSR